MRHLWIIAALLSALLLRSAHAAEPVEPQPVPSALGVSIAWQRGDEWAAESLALLQPLLWMNWLHDHNDDATYVPMAYSLATGYHDTYIAAGKLARHKTWLLGSEPNITATYTEPSEAALFTQRWADEVGTPFACCGVIVHHNWQGNLVWLDEYLAAGGVVPDYWSINLYFHANAQEWQQSLDTFMAWMIANDVVRPIIVQETAMTEAGDAAVLLEYINSKVKDGAIYAALWYSDRDYWQVWPQSDLRTESGELTELGMVYVGLGGAGEPTADDVVAQPMEPYRLWLPAAYP